MLDNNNWKHLTVCKPMRSCSFKNNAINKLFANTLYIYIYVYIVQLNGDSNSVKPL